MLSAMDGHVTEWDAALRSLLDRVGGLFARPEPREVFADLVGGLLSDLEKKNGWTLAQRAGHAHPGRMQSFLSRGAWSAQALEAQVRRYVVGELGCDDGVLIVDDTQVVKKGRMSVGVAPQHCGATNQTENCQVAVMLTYASSRGHAFIGHRLYLPARWTDDPARCRAAGVPAEVGFATKPQQAVQLLAEALAAGVPFGWVAMDGGYGQYDTVRHWCRDRSVPYVMAVPRSLPLLDPAGASGRAEDLLGQVDEAAWERRSCGQGAKGQRFYDWAFAAVRVKGEDPAAGFAHTLLIRRSISDPTEVAYFLVHAAQQTPMPQMVQVAGMRWKIEENNEQGKDLIGLDQYQVRTWTAWHHYVTACMFAHAFLVVQRARLLSEHHDQHDDHLAAGTEPDHARAQDADQGKDPRPPPPHEGSAPNGSPRPPSPRSATSSPAPSSTSTMAAGTTYAGSPGASPTRSAPS
jgi:SRSO17 transposase